MADFSAGIKTDTISSQTLHFFDSSNRVYALIDKKNLFCHVIAIMLLNLASGRDTVEPLIRTQEGQSEISV